MLDLLKNLIRIESISGNEQKLIEFFAPWIEKSFKIAPQVIDRSIVLDIKGASYKENDPQSPTLLLCSHIDTVSPSASWTKDPFGAEQIEDRIYGLGANDALASVVSMTFGALDALKSINRGRLLLSFVCEEEKGNKGFFTVEPQLPRYTYAIFGEPTSLRIGYCMRGAMKLRMVSEGISCHASRPHEGKNAIFKLASDLEKIRDLPLDDSSPWGRATVEPTVVRGGTAENQIPDRVETILDVRTTIEKNNKLILQMLVDSGITYEILANVRKPMFCDEQSPLIQAIQRAIPSCTFYPFGGTCDMAFSKSPSVVFGPGASERSHASDEFIKVGELEEGAKAYSSIIQGLLS